nr:phage antirepressor N-terminal domain-containing protein [Moellerella wisconsensis]
MNTISTINVPFHGDNLFIVNHNGQPYVPMKPIVEGMGLDWMGQYRKLTQRFSKGIEEMSIPTKGGDQSMICLALRKLTGWLHTISPNKVKPEIRDKVIQYQEECDDVLYEYWTTGEVKAKHKSTVQERNPLKNAVNLLVSKKGIMYPEAYSLVHQKFNVSGIDELTADQIPMAVEYVHKLVMEGEYIPKQDALPMPKFNKHKTIHTLEGAVIHIRAMKEHWNNGLKDSLKQLGYQHTGSMTEHMTDILFHLDWAIHEIKGDNLDKLPA